MVAVLVYGVQVDVFQFPLKGWWLAAGLTYVMYRLSRQGDQVAGESPATNRIPGVSFALRSVDGVFGDGWFSPVQSLPTLPTR